MDSDNDARLKTLEKIVGASHTAFFVTESAGGLHGRPMATAKAEPGLKTLWFSSHKSSGKTAELQRDSRVFLGYSNASGAEWASITGTASLVDDRAKIKAMYSPMWNNWFSGPDDPDLILIAVTPQSAEYWDSGSKLVVMLKIAVGAITGHKSDYGENKQLDLNR